MKDALKIYKVNFFCPETGNKMAARFFAKNPTEIEFAVSSDPDSDYVISKIELIGVVGCAYRGIVTIDAAAYKQSHEKSKGEHEPLDFSQYMGPDLANAPF